MLDCPATQCWLISMLGNATGFGALWLDQMNPKDSHLMAHLNAIFKDIPQNEVSDSITSVLVLFALVAITSD